MWLHGQLSSGGSGSVPADWLRQHPRNPHFLTGCCTELRAGEQGRRRSEGPGQGWVVAVPQQGADITDDGPGFQSQVYLCKP